MTTLELFGVPESLTVGFESKGTKVKNQSGETHVWRLDVNPAVGLTVSQLRSSLENGKEVEVTITPTIAGHYSITLTGNAGAPGSGSPAMTVAYDPAVQLYRELLADLQTLKF